jgi:hypothetical protein
MIKCFQLYGIIYIGILVQFKGGEHSGWNSCCGDSNNYINFRDM